VYWTRRLDSGHFALTLLVVRLVLGNLKLVVDVDGLRAFCALEMFGMPRLVHRCDTFGLDRIVAFGTLRRKRVMVALLAVWLVALLHKLVLSNQAL